MDQSSSNNADETNLAPNQSDTQEKINAGLALLVKKKRSKRSRDKLSKIANSEQGSLESLDRGSNPRRDSNASGSVDSSTIRAQSEEILNVVQPDKAIEGIPDVSSDRVTQDYEELTKSTDNAGYKDIFQAYQSQQRIIETGQTEDEPILFSGPKDKRTNSKVPIATPPSTILLSESLNDLKETDDSVFGVESYSERKTTSNSAAQTLTILQQTKSTSTPDLHEPDSNNVNQRLKHLESQIETERNLRLSSQNETEFLKKLLERLNKELQYEQRLRKDLDEKFQILLNESQETKESLEKTIQDQQNKLEHLQNEKSELESRLSQLETNKPENRDYSFAASEIIKLEQSITLLKEENERIKSNSFTDWKTKYIHSCTKITELIKERRRLIYEIDSLKSKDGSRKPSLDVDVESLIEKIKSLETRNKNLVKVVVKLTSINWHQEEIISKLSDGPRIKLPESIERIEVGKDTDGMWSISSNPDRNEVSIPEDLLELMREENSSHNSSHFHV